MNRCIVCTVEESEEAPFEYKFCCYCFCSIISEAREYAKSVPHVVDTDMLMASFAAKKISDMVEEKQLKEILKRAYINLLEMKGV